MTEPVPVTVAERTVLADGTVRYRLSNGWFIDRDHYASDRPYRPWPYALWEPGAGLSGGARYAGSRPRLRDALILADQAQDRRRRDVTVTAADQGATHA